MPFPLKVLLLYLAAISLTSILVTVADKRRARRRKWRVPEATLLLLSALGGSAAMFVTMKIIRHKTQHRKFMWGIPTIFVLQAAVAAAILAGLYQRGLL